jgi:hypothetical protein
MKPKEPSFGISHICLLLALLLLPLAITNDSLWLDEGDTAMYALEPSYHSWCERLLHDSQADCQMPLSLLAAWVGAKLFGAQEWQLRAVNLLWGALALLAFDRVGRRLKLPWLPLLLAVQPYFWFYLNEARPYALQIAGGAWLLAALVEFDLCRGEGIGWAWQLAFAGFFLFCGTMLAPLPVAATVFAIGLIAWREKWRPSRKAVLILLGGLAACLPVAAYYASTLLRGAKGMQMWQVDLKFVAYVFYELTGMGGIGLSSAEIRSLARSPQLAHELMSRLPQLVLPLVLGALLALVIVVGLRRGSRDGRRPLLIGIAAVPLMVSAVFIPGSLVLQKAFWARHYAPVFPFYVALLGLAFAGIASSPRRWLRLLPLAVVALLVWSVFNFRFAPALRKEDYRAASAFAKNALADGKTVWWLAGDYTALYYGLPLSYELPERGKAFAEPHSHEDCRQFPFPAVIVLSKPDIHDSSGVVQKIISENHYAEAKRFQGFVIWTNAALPK